MGSSDSLYVRKQDFQAVPTPPALPAASKSNPPAPPIAPKTTEELPQYLRGATIMLNPGHGIYKGQSLDTGAVVKKTTEAELNKAVADEFVEQLKGKYKERIQVIYMDASNNPKGKKDVHKTVAKSKNQNDEAEYVARVYEQQLAQAKKTNPSGLKIIYVRDTIHRIQAIEDIVGPNLFVALHQDKNSDPCTRGTTVYVNGQSGASYNAAQAVEGALRGNDPFIKNTCSGPKHINNEPKNSLFGSHGINSTEGSGLAVLKANAEIPAMLIECAEMKFSRDLSLISSKKGQEGMASRLISGVQNFFAARLARH